MWEYFAELDSLLIAFVASIITCIIGFYIIRIKSTPVCWLLFLLTTFIIERLSKDDHAVVRMLDIILVMFVGMKIITTTESLKLIHFKITFPQWIAFTFGWAGMRAEIFQTLGQKPIAGWEKMVLSGIRCLAAGLLLVLFAKFLYKLGGPSELMVITISILLLAGFSLVLHFGLLAISAGTWKFFDVKTYYLFDDPLHASGLSSFWSKRWNRAFSEMTSLAVYRPLKNKLGNRMALILSFLFSGLLHEAAISLPVKKGFGLPLLYFTIQALIILLEQFLAKNNFTFYREGVAGKIWLWFWIIAPAPILFHIHFLKGIIWPLAGLHFP